MTEQRKKMTSRERGDLFHRKFAERVIAMLKEGTAPWQKPWEPARHSPHFNPVTGTVYRGINRIITLMSGYDDPRWMTYQQARAAGYQVRRGEKGTHIAHYKWTLEKDRLDENGRPVLDADGNPEKEIIRLQRPIVSLYSVFNVAQIEGDIPPLPKDPGHEWNPHERAEKILEASRADIRHDQADRAFYRPFTDEIHLPPKDRFDAPDKYYATALHELGHWTGHKSRLDRTGGAFGTEAYAREELRAEIASWMLGEEIGVGHDPGDHAAYVQSWIRALEDDPSEIARACRDAEDIRDYLLELEREHENALDEESQVAPDRAPDSETVAEQTTLQGGEPLSARASDKGRPPERGPAPPWVEIVYDDKQNGKIWLDVPYREKNQAKQQGAQWDKIERRWYALEGADMAGLAAWLPKEARPDMPPKIATEKTWLAVPYNEKNQAKRLGARWDDKAQSWYAPAGTDLHGLERWLPEHNRDVAQSSPRSVLSPEEEFRDKLTELGLDLRGQLPIMDGMPHRVPVVEKNGRGMDGCYCLYNDGRPAGWAQNHVTGAYAKLVATGARLSPEELARQRATFAAKKAEHEQQRRAQHAEAARKAVEHYGKGHAVTTHPYLENKGVPPLGPVREMDGKLLIPIWDANGSPRGLQTIDHEGQKRFTPGMEKKGGFCLLDDEKRFNGGEIILCEGYATGVSLALATEKPVAVAFDAGNLEAVAEALRAKFPRVAITICADNDHATERDGKPWNPGVEKAKAAAQKVGGKVIVPAFSEAEKAQRLTDFNDLHKSQGLGAVKRQVARAQEQNMER